MDTLRPLLALHVTPADADDGAAVAELAEAVQDATGERAAEAASAHGIALEVVKPPEARTGFVLLARRRVVERSFA